MKKITSLLMSSLTFIIFNFSSAQVPTFLWAKGYGGTGDDGNRSIAVDASGNIYTTGYFTDTVDFDPGAGIFNLISPAGGTDIFISKLDASGNFVWAKRMGGISNDAGSSIVLDASGNIYTTGFFWGTVDFDPGAGIYNLTAAGYSDIFISKLDANGNFVWAKNMGGTNWDEGGSIATDAFGNVYTTGYFWETVDFDPGAGIYNLTSAGYGDIFISKLDSSGNFVWAKTMGATRWDVGASIALDASGNVYISGQFRDTVDFDPGAGVFNLTSVTIWGDVFICKLDASGNFVWAKSMEGNGTNDASASRFITLDAIGNLYSTGWFSGTVDFDPGPGIYNLTSAGGDDIFISKLDGSGNFIWAKSMGGSNNDYGLAITLDASGNIYYTGYFVGTADFDPGAGVYNLTSGGANIFISRLDNSGNFVWAKATGVIGGNGNDYGNSITIAPQGKVLVAGSFRSPTIAFDLTTLVNAGYGDAYIAALDISTGLPIAESEDGFLVYPNPATNNLTCTINKPGKNIRVTVTDNLGKVIYSAEPEKVNGKMKIEINTRNFAEGIYLVLLYSDNYFYTKKFIVEK